MSAKIYFIKPNWHGPNRRVAERRGAERRAEVRYEPSREDRRSGVDRREVERAHDAYRLSRRIRRFLDQCQLSGEANSPKS